MTTATSHHHNELELEAGAAAGAAGDEAVAAGWDGIPIGTRDVRHPHPLVDGTAALRTGGGEAIGIAAVPPPVWRISGGGMGMAMGPLPPPRGDGGGGGGGGMIDGRVSVSVRGAETGE